LPGLSSIKKKKLVLIDKVLMENSSVLRKIATSQR